MNLRQNIADLFILDFFELAPQKTEQSGSTLFVHHKRVRYSDQGQAHKWVWSYPWVLPNKWAKTGVIQSHNDL